MHITDAGFGGLHGTIQGDLAMKKVFSLLAAGCAFAALVPAEASANPQHERMRRCNQEAKAQALKGDARQQFMSTCLKGKHEQTAPQAAGPALEAAPAQAPAAPAAAVEGSAAQAPVTQVGPVAAPAAGTPAPAASVASPPQAAQPVAGAAASEREKRCNQVATEQALTGAKRKTFISGCMAG
jgi:hypothetical protein